MSDPPTGKKGDCYSKGEREWMLRTQQLRARLLHPLLVVLARLRITPDHLTLLSLLCGFAFCPLFGPAPHWAFFTLFLHVVVDGLDGPLARHLGLASRAGSFTDTMSDQIVVTAVTITLMTTGHVSIAAGGVYVFVYAVVVAFAMIRNTMAIPYSWLIRPRFIVYLWMPIEVYLWPNTIEWLMWGFSALLGWKMLTGFQKIRRQLS